MATINEKSKVVLPLAIIITLASSIGTTVYNLWNKNNDLKYSILERDLTSLKNDTKESISTLHRRMNEISQRIIVLEQNGVGYGIILQNINNTLQEIKTDIKEIKRIP